MRQLFLLVILALSIVRADDDIQKISLPSIPDLQRTDLYTLKLTEQPAAILVLCPGCNGNGKAWMQEPVWQEFAKAHNLNLAGLSFASDVSLLTNGRGYYYASQGSGQLLLDGLSRAFDSHLPLILYGFSGGAHFTSRFVEWKPDRVMAWCAYSAEWWDRPAQNDVNPPGIVGCGESDVRYGASLAYFEQGRALGKPWLWICAPKTAHAIYPPVEVFARNYFATILKGIDVKLNDEWIDIEHGTTADKDTVTVSPTLTGWLPDASLRSEWKEVESK